MEFIDLIDVGLHKEFYSDGTCVAKIIRFEYEIVPFTNYRSLHRLNGIPSLARCNKCLFEIH